ncbi:MAG: hypothetical protein ACE5I2_06115 [Anaerolineae bacterium]
MYSTADLRLEAQEALDRVWFVQSLEEIERTDFTLSLRLHIRPALFVQAFLGELSGSLYLALIEGGQRIFGIDREGGEWHLRRYDTPDDHEPLPEGLGPRPLLKFLARVEDLLLQHDLL